MRIRLARRVIKDRSTSFGVCKQVESGQDNGALHFDIPWYSQWSAHDVRGDDGARYAQLLEALSKSMDCDDHGRDAGIFDQPGDVSNGHMADRSQWYQEHGFDILFLEHFYPCRIGLGGQFYLGGGSNERICSWR